ncbi:MAG: hypothetical protein ACJ78Q_12205 [Chloroflexia bacterium]
MVAYDQSRQHGVPSEAGARRGDRAFSNSTLKPYLQEKVDALKKLQAETAAEVDALLPAVLDRALKGSYSLAA